jgi:hypothetical protein
MRLLAIAAVLALVPLGAGACNKPHQSPENPTIILALVGGSIMMWRSLRARPGRSRA